MPPVIDYTARDFDTALAALRDHVQAVRPDLLPSFDDTNGAGRLLLELFAYGIDVASMGSDVLANEVNVDTARNLQSLLALASQTAGLPPVGAPARGYAFLNTGQRVAYTVTYAGSPPAPVFPADTVYDTLSPGTTFLDNRNIPWRVLDGAQLYSGRLTQTSEILEEALDHTTTAAAKVWKIPCVQVETASVTLSPSGRPGFSAEIPFVDGLSHTLPDTVAVSDGSGAWTQVATLTKSLPADRHYVVEVRSPAALVLKFGDAVTGAIPSATLTVAYDRTRGAGGNPNITRDLAADQIANIPAAQFNSYTTTQALVAGVGKCTLAAWGGDVPLDIEKLRTYVKNARQTTGALCTARDYEVAAMRVPGVFAARAYWKASNDAATMVSLEVWKQGNVTDGGRLAVDRYNGQQVFNLPDGRYYVPGPAAPDSGLVDAVRTALSDRLPVGTLLNTTSGGLVDNIDLYVDLGLTASDSSKVLGACRAAVNGLFNANPLKVSPDEIEAALRAITKTTVRVVRMVRGSGLFWPLQGYIEFNAFPEAGDSVIVSNPFAPNTPSVYTFVATAAEAGVADDSAYVYSPDAGAALYATHVNVWRGYSLSEARANLAAALTSGQLVRWSASHPSDAYLDPVQLVMTTSNGNQFFRTDAALQNMVDVPGTVREFPVSDETRIGLGTRWTTAGLNAPPPPVSITFSGGSMSVTDFTQTANDASVWDDYRFNPAANPDPWPVAPGTAYKPMAALETYKDSPDALFRTSFIAGNVLRTVPIYDRVAAFRLRDFVLLAP